MSCFLQVIVGREMALAIDERMAHLNKLSSTPSKATTFTAEHEKTMAEERVAREELMEWLEFVVVRWGTNSSTAGSTGLAREVHAAMGDLLTYLRTGQRSGEANELSPDEKEKGHQQDANKDCKLIVVDGSGGGGYFTAVFDAFALLRSRVTEHVSVVHRHDLELLVPVWNLSRWLRASSNVISQLAPFPTAKRNDAAEGAGTGLEENERRIPDLAAFIRVCNAKASAIGAIGEGLPIVVGGCGEASEKEEEKRVEMRGAAKRITSATACNVTTVAKFSRVIANPCVSISELVIEEHSQEAETSAGASDQRKNEEVKRDGSNSESAPNSNNPLLSPHRRALEKILSSSRKRNLHLLRLRRHVEEEEYNAIAGKTAEMARASESQPDTFRSVMKDMSIGLDMRLMALAGGVVGYYLCHIRGLEQGTCWVGAVCGVILMTIVDALLMIIRISKDDIKSSKAKRKKDIEKGKR